MKIARGGHEGKLTPFHKLMATLVQGRVPCDFHGSPQSRFRVELHSRMVVHPSSQNLRLERWEKSKSASALVKQRRNFQISYFAVAAKQSETAMRFLAGFQLECHEFRKYKTLEQVSALTRHFRKLKSPRDTWRQNHDECCRKNSNTQYSSGPRISSLSSTNLPSGSLDRLLGYQTLALFLWHLCFLRSSLFESSRWPQEYSSSIDSCGIRSLAVVSLELHDTGAVRSIPYDVSKAFWLCLWGVDNILEYTYSALLSSNSILLWVSELSLSRSQKKDRLLVYAPVFSKSWWLVT